MAKRQRTRTKRKYYRLRARAPYDSKGNTTLRLTNKKPGVYKIYENGKLVYIGMSKNNLYRTMYRHFQEWNHRGQPVVTYAGKNKKYSVQVTLCTPGRAAKAEHALIVKYKPRDNPNKYRNYKLNFNDQEIINEFEGVKMLKDEEVPF